jgi:hypothetical protein
MLYLAHGNNKTEVGIIIVRQNNKLNNRRHHYDPGKTAGDYETGWSCCHCYVGKGWSAFGEHLE